MASSQDSSVSSSEEALPEKRSPDVNALLNRLLESANEKDGKRNEVQTGGEEDSRITKVFPWIRMFNKLCQAEIGSININSLENLMTVYIRNVSLSVKECYLKPNRAAKLKKNMNDTLILFHMFYSEIKKPLEHSSYLDKMSDLLAMYMDMEIKASRRGKESLPKIASKLTSSLYVFLDRSQDHILDAVLKTKYMNKNFWEICVLILSRVLRDSPGRAVYEMTYVRYILGFKMWKRVVRGAEERRKVMHLASSKLFPPTNFREKLRAGLLSGVLPKIPKSRKDITMFLMQAKFCIKEKTKAFLKAVGDPKQQGVLSCTQLAADLDRPMFFNEDVDSSRNSNSDEQEETSGSSMLMNDIWSSMSVDAGGIADHLRLASLTLVKTKKVKKKVVRCKGIATPVFKTDTTEITEKEKKKKKKKKEKAEEEKGVEVGKAEAVVAPLVESSTPGVAEEKEKELEKEIEKEREVEREETIGVVGVIKVEPSEVCIVGQVKPIEKEVEQVNQVDSVSGGEKETEMLDIAEEVEIESGGGESGGVKLEPPPAQSSSVHDIFLYDDQHNFYNNTVNDFLVEYLNNSKLHDFVLDSGQEERDIYERFGENKGLNVKPRETLYPEEVVESGYCDPVETKVNDAEANLSREANQDLIAKMIESLNDRVRYSNEAKTQVPPPQPPKTLADLQAKVPIEILALGDKDKGMLHERTLRRDHAIFVLQQKFRTYYIRQNIPPPSPVPCPFEVDCDMKVIPRCLCEQCYANQVALVTNYKTLSHYRYKNDSQKKDHLEEVVVRIEEKLREEAIKVEAQKETEARKVKEEALKQAALKEEAAKQVALKEEAAKLAALEEEALKLEALKEEAKKKEEEMAQQREESGGKDVKEENSEQESSLPLKKRKGVTLTSSTSLKTEETQSYPCTPMMSIAALEESKASLKALGYIPVDYTVATPSTSVPPPYYPPVVPTPYSSVIVKEAAVAKPQSNIVSGSYTPYQQSPEERVRFRTPAQLKEGVAPEIAAAHDLINFAHTSHKYYSTTHQLPPPAPTPPTTRSRHKHKSSKSEGRTSKRRRQN